MNGGGASAAPSLTPYLQVCCCAIQNVAEGDVCSTCSCLGQWEGDHYSMCSADNCKVSARTPATECIGCDMTWHPAFYEDEAGCSMHCGLKRDGSPGARCQDCFKQAEECGALEIIAARDIDASSSFEASKRPAAPPSDQLKKKKTRPAAKATRELAEESLPAVLVPCTTGHKWSQCGGCKGHAGLECARVSDADRQRYRAKFELVRHDNKPRALHRAMALVYGGLRWPITYPQPATNPAQACFHCRHLPVADWKPTRSHRSMNCALRVEVCKGAQPAKQAEYWLWTEDHGHVQVCRGFYYSVQIRSPAHARREAARRPQLAPMLNPTDEFDAAYLVAEWPEPTEALVNAEDVEDDG